MMKEHWSKPLWEGTVVDKELQHFPTFTEVEGADYKAAITATRCQQADIVREIIPAEEIVPLFERHWISIQRNDHETLD